MTRHSLQPRNQLLAALPGGVLQRLESHLHPFDLIVRDVLYEPGDRVRYAVFPERGVISLVNVGQDGRSIEVGTIGHEGMTGVAALWGIDFVPYRCVVQIPGSAWRIKCADLLKEAGPMQRLMLHYHVAFTSQIMQSTACAGLHSIEQRCCRWLLTTRDRVDSDPFSLSHEFLALMLGTRRATVSQVMKKLQDRGLIKYQRGRITIADRAGLVTSSCECYQVVADAYRRVMRVARQS
ncbi:MAG TPA: Crp/Fnr family transcriptional regulator [Planctomycetaceae bacterium]|jgi:CRP-like cAMP-binding protein